MKKVNMLQKRKTFNFLTQKEHERIRDERLSPWIEALLPADGRFMISERFKPFLESISKNNTELISKQIFPPEADMNQDAVFMFYVVAHDVAYCHESDYPEFTFCFNYSGKVDFTFSYSIHGCDFEFLLDFYSKKLNIKLEINEKNIIYSEIPTWYEGYILIQGILKARSEIIPLFK